MPAVPWGKLDRDAPDRARAARLSLVAHSVDVAAVLQALLELPAVRRQLDTLAGRTLTDTDCARLVALAFLHDVGKAGAGFHGKGLAADVQARWTSSARADQLGHTRVALPLLMGVQGLEEAVDALGVREIMAWGGASVQGQALICDLWLAAISHHGAPIVRGEPLAVHWPTWTQPIGAYLPLPGLRMLNDAVHAIWPQAFSAELTAAVRPGLIHAFAGWVSVADWIGSNTDERFFPYQIHAELGDPALQGPERWPHALRRARRVLCEMRLDVESIRADFKRRQPAFIDLFDAPPYDTQQQAGAVDIGPLVVLEAETGSGKTEAALWRFASLFAAGEVDALCFLLPTRVAATAIYERIGVFVQRAFPDPALRPAVVLAVPQYLRANGREGALVEAFTVQWPDDLAEGERPMYWAAENSKRYFAATAVAGTIDQFLLTALQNKHAHLRASLSLRALVVVDEVHASDAYMTALLRLALRRHVAAGGHALLMSATLTGQARARLLLTGVPPRQTLARQALLADPGAPYPCLASQTGLLACAGSPRRKQVGVHTLAAMRDPYAVAALTARALAQGARVLVLRNTVRQAVATQQALEALLGADHPALFRLGRSAALHHGSYAFDDRRALDRQVEALFGKSAFDDRQARVLVGTQTLEISIDCDADVLITDLVPMDVLLQRLGRLHRHEQRDGYRSIACRQPAVWVLTPENRDLARLLEPGGAQGLGLGRMSAYENLLAVEATWTALEAESMWDLPAMNRRLVEATIDADRLDELAQRLGGAWPKHHGEVVAIDSAKAGHALPITVDWSKDWGDGGWSELGGQARTRLGLDGIDVDLPQPWPTPLGQQVARLSVPAWMLPGAKPPVAVDALRDEGTALHLSIAGRDFIYDRWGLRADGAAMGK